MLILNILYFIILTENVFSTRYVQILSEVIPVNVILVILVMEEPALILTSVLLNLIIANQGLVAKTLLVDSHAKI